MLIFRGLVRAQTTEFGPRADTGVDAYMHGGTRQKEPVGAHIRSASTTSENAGEGCRRLG